MTIHFDHCGHRFDLIISATERGGWWVGWQIHCPMCGEEIGQRCAVMEVPASL